MTDAFVYLSKLLPTLIYPLGLACLLLLAATVLRRQRSWTTAAVSLALLILFVGGNRYVAMTLAKSLEWQYLPSAEIPAAEAIVVLGGGTESADYPRTMVEVNAAGDRVLYAASLYKDGKAPNILLSGGKIDWLDPSEDAQADEMASLLDLVDIPRQALWLQSQSRNTAEDAAFSADLLKEHGVTRILLVTSAMHMPRSVALFEKQGLEVIPAPTDFGVTQQRWQTFWQRNFGSVILNQLPNASRLNMTTNALKEYIGMLVYSLQGWQ